MRLIGRHRDLEIVGEVLGRARLVTLLGPPGIGKTTTARAFARGGSSSHRFAALDASRTVQDAIDAVATAAGLESAGRGVAEIGKHLEHVGVELLIVDNLEHLTPEIGELIATILSATDGLKILGTSRRRLGLPQEHVVELTPLAQGSSGPAAELFEERARQLEPGWRAENDRALATVLEFTGGVPLAIELAASRLRIMNIDELAERLAQASRPAGAGEYDLLASSVASSWDLLDEVGRKALIALANLPGAFPTDLAESVVRAVTGEGIELVQRLRDDSLLSRAGDQLSLLPFVREFALGESRKSASGAVDADQIAEAICRAAEPHSEGFMETGRAAPLGRLGAYVPALTMVLERPGIHRSRAASILAVYFARRGRATDRTRFLNAVAELFGGSSEPPEQIILRIAAVCSRQDDCALGLEWLERLQPPADPAGDDASEAPGDDAELTRLAMSKAIRAALLNTARRYEEALSLLAEAQPVLEEAQLDVYLLRSYVSEFVAHYYLGDLPSARSAAMATLQYADRMSRPPDYFLGVVFNNLCFLNSILGNAVEARQQGARALELFEIAGDHRAATMARGYLGLLAMNLGDLDGAAAHFDDAVESHRLRGDRLHESFNLANLAELAALRGDEDATRSYMSESERVAALVEWPGIEVHNCGVEATLALTRGDLAAAERALTAGLEHDAVAGMPNEHAHFTLMRAFLRRVASDDRWTADWESMAELEERVTNPHFRAAFAVLRLGLTEPESDAFDDRVELASRTLRSGLADQPSIEDSFLVRRAWSLVGSHLDREVTFAVLADYFDPQKAGLCWSPGAERVRLPGGEWVDLSRRNTLMSTLVALLRARMRDESLSTEMLFEEVWPEEAAHPDAASNRVYNALALLRRMGFADLLDRTEAGYELAPNLAYHELQVESWRALTCRGSGS